MRIHHSTVVVWALAGGLLLASGCFVGSSGADCAPGNQIQCVCTDQTAGVRVCRDDGTYGACQCGVLPDGGTTPGPDGGTVTDGGTATDGGTPTDGGTVTDGGTPTDGGTATDGGTVTDGGTAADGGTPTDGGTVSCPSGFTDCGGTCVDLTTDAAHCGACARACPTGGACNKSACVCPGGGSICNDACTDTQADALNCGTCGHACAVTQACVGGVCQVPPDCRTSGCTGFNWCDTTTGDCQPGCAQDSQCGSGEVCDTATHACTCAPGYTSCNGACVDLTTDNANCGTCGKACTGTQSCQGSTCVDRGGACTSYDPTGRLASCSPLIGACSSPSLECTGLLPIFGPYECVDQTPCQTSPTSQCCTTGQFCGADFLGLGTGKPFCCTPGEDLKDGSGGTCIDAGLDIGCHTDADCPVAWHRPICDTALAHPKCVQCLSTSQCPSGKLCDTASNKCVQCLSTSDCPSGKLCDTTKHDCVECLHDTDCPGTRPYCFTDIGACGECKSDTDCTTAPNLKCNTGSHQCVQCNANADCSGSTPLCGISGVCEQCPVSESCGTAVDGQKACLPVTYKSSCTTSADCASSLKTCIHDSTGNYCAYKCQ